MGYYAYANEEYVGDVASNGGFFEWGRFADSLSEKEFPELAHLAAHGYTTHCEALAKECERAQSAKGSDDAKGTCRRIAELATKAAKKKADIFMISDGTSDIEPKSDDPEQDAEEAKREKEDAMSEEKEMSMSANGGGRDDPVEQKSIKAGDAWYKRFSKELDKRLSAKKGRGPRSKK